MRKIISETHGDVSGALVVVVAGLVAIIIGVMVWFKINGALYSSMGYSTTSSASYNLSKVAYASVNTTANTVWTLFPIVSIVMVAGVILAIVMGFGRSQA